jgi:tetratricopeptide (TPR) repeat protein
MLTTTRIFIAAALATTLSFSPALAFPDEDNTAPPKTQPVKKSAKKLKCKRGETAKQMRSNGTTKLMCVKLKSEMLLDSELYNQARLLADEGEYEWALDHLRLMSNQKDPKVLSYTGYTNRKAGRLETGISYYHQALSINPNYVQAREYLGEAYALAGFDALAREQLSEIEKRCGTGCDAYVKLNEFMTQQEL